MLKSLYVHICTYVAADFNLVARPKFELGKRRAGDDLRTGAVTVLS